MVNVDIVLALGGSPASNMYWVPPYPVRRSRNAAARRMRGPRESTIRPHQGALSEMPTGDTKQITRGKWVEKKGIRTTLV
jgi:hypothetical protein